MLDHRFHPSLSYSQRSGSNFMSERVKQEAEIKWRQHSRLLSQEQHFLSWSRIKACGRKTKSGPSEDQSALGELTLRVVLILAFLFIVQNITSKSVHWTFAKWNPYCLSAGLAPVQGGSDEIMIYFKVHRYWIETDSQFCYKTSAFQSSVAWEVAKRLWLFAETMCFCLFKAEWTA